MNNVLDRLRAFLGARHIGVRAWLAIAAVWGLGLAAVGASDAWHATVTPVVKRLEFRYRSMVGRTPKLDARLKIFGFDDQAVASLQATEPTLRDWGDLIAAIGKARPRAIVIDKIFGVLPLDSVHASADIEYLKTVLAATPNVYAGASLSQVPIRWRSVLDLAGPAYELTELTGGSLGAADWLPVRGGYAYGPDPRIAPAFREIGLLSDQGDGDVAAIVRLTGRIALPHVALAALGPVRVSGSGIKVGSQDVPVTADGTFPANLAGPEDFFAHTYSLRVPIENVRAKLPVTGVSQGDIVLVLPLLYTGNVDIEQTPVGRLPRGYKVAAVLNSFLTNQWLVPIGGAAVLTVGAAVAGAMLAAGASGSAFWGLLVTTALLGVFLALQAFSVVGLVLPWTAPLLAYFGAAVSVFAERTRRLDGEARRIKASFEQQLAGESLAALVKSPSKIRREPAERVVTLMFIDIVGFSVYAEEHLPRQVFENLKGLLARLSDTVHAHKGVVDKTLGDGMLCFFGYSFDGAPSGENQADLALDCAVAIQRDNVARLLRGEFSMPLRIGLNTASVYVGDLGSAERMDFTVIGNGVNLAKRFEAACEPNLIMLAPTTLDLAARQGVRRPELRQRLIQMKHHEGLVEAVELDPISGEPALKSGLAELERQKGELPRKHQRWAVLKPEVLVVRVHGEPAVLVDFSAWGVSVRTQKYYARGVTVPLVIEPVSGRAAAGWNAIGVDCFYGEVRWGRPAETGFLHGLMIKNVSKQQADLLLGLLRGAVADRESA